MEKNCINCKWYYNQKCNCNDFQLYAEINNINNGITYIEDGIFNENIEESGLTKGLINLVIKTLKEQDYIKRNKNINKLDTDILEQEIKEDIDEKLSSSIMNYFDYSLGVVTDIKINDPKFFHCCNWE